MGAPRTVNDVAEQTRSGSQYNLITNGVENYFAIKEAFKKARPDLTAIQLPPGTPVMIVGSGPSLDENVEQMRGWRGAIFCTPQTYPILMSRGIVPQFVTAIDTSIDDVVPLEGEGNSYTTLITHPAINPKLIGGVNNVESCYGGDGTIFLRSFKPAWKGPTIFIQVLFDDETDFLFKAMHPYISFVVGAQGCVSNMQLIMAGALKATNVVLVGMDMQNTDKGQEHARNWRKVGNWRWEMQKVDYNNPPNEIHVVMQFYRLLMSVIWKGTGVNLFKIGRGLDLIPDISWEDACAKNFPKPMPKHELNKKIDEYTIPYGVYGSTTQGNMDFIEFAERLQKKPKNDMEKEKAKRWTQDEAGVWHRKMD